MTVFSALWLFSSSTVMADPGARHFRSDTVAGQLAMSITDDDSIDRHTVLVAVAVEDRVAIRSTQTAGDWYTFRVVASPVDLVTWVRLDVAVISTGDMATAPGNNDRLLFDFVTPPASGSAWITAGDLVEFLGPSVDAGDPLLATCADAANSYCYRKRLEAGYVDDPIVVPSPDVELGTTMYGVALYRERGSADSFASFDETIGFAQVGTWPRIKQLLGVPRARVDLPLSEVPAAVPLRRGWRL